MSERIVILGPAKGAKMKAATVTPMDAGAFLNGGNWRVALSLFTGPLSNATVLQHLDRDGADSQPSEGDWRAALRMCPAAKSFEIQIPLSLAEYRP